MSRASDRRAREDAKHLAELRSRAVAYTIARRATEHTDPSAPPPTSEEWWPVLAEAREWMRSIVLEEPGEYVSLFLRQRKTGEWDLDETRSHVPKRRRKR